MHSARAGFTLIEVLVVLALMGVLAGVAALSWPGDPYRQARHEAERLQQVMQMAADTAVYQGDELGAYFTRGGYGFLRYDTAARQWRSLSDQALKPHQLPKDIGLSLTLAGRALPLSDAANKPAVIFLSSGEMTAFTVQVSHRVHKDAFVVGSDGLNPVQVREDRP